MVDILGKSAAVVGVVKESGQLQPSILRISLEFPLPLFFLWNVSSTEKNYLQVRPAFLIPRICVMPNRSTRADNGTSDQSPALDLATLSAH